ncbi:MAG: right-handed parallel beta-helix repeat-containing protein [Phycisphaeraceae bacterium]
MKRYSLRVLATALVMTVLILVSPAAYAGAAARPVGDPVLEAPTLMSLGAYWIIGDDNDNASVELHYRKGGAAEWLRGMDLLKVESGAEQRGDHEPALVVPKDARLFAGSIVLLEPDTAYEMKLVLRDPDGAAAEHMLSARTNAEPKAPANGPVYYVMPGDGGAPGSGTEADPYRGIAEAEKHARPGDTFLLQAGVYTGPITLRRSGEPGKPIIWRGAAGHGKGETILQGAVDDAERPGRGISMDATHHIWLEDLTIRNSKWAIVAHEASHIVLRRCHIHSVEFGFTATKNSKGTMGGFFIADNLIEGPSTWPRSQGIEDARGIQISGVGSDVCYNRISGFGDAIDTMPSSHVSAIDFHHNDVSELTDDGIEMDYSFRNTRCFNNRLTNVYQGISVQPIYGGPVYVFRNAMYNVVVEPFKMHNGPSGALMFHNTVVKKGMPLALWTSKPISNCVYRNNLFIGTTDKYAFACEAKATNCDYDYDGFGGGPFPNFMKWNGVKYATIEDVRTKAPIYKNIVAVDPATAFASGVLPPDDETKQHTIVDLRLADGTAARDAGQVLPGFNDGFGGKAPDLGAYEAGADVPHYGPRSLPVPLPAEGEVR